MCNGQNAHFDTALLSFDEFDDEFRWVLMGFNEFRWVLMSFDEFQWVLMSFDELWWVLISSVGFWWDLMTSDRFWWTLMSFNAQSKLYIYKTRHSRTPKWPITSPIQPKSNFLFHKKSPLQDFNIMTLARVRSSPT